MHLTQRGEVAMSETTLITILVVLGASVLLEAVWIAALASRVQDMQHVKTNRRWMKIKESGDDDFYDRPVHTCVPIETAVKLLLDHLEVDIKSEPSRDERFYVVKGK
jgi:hypothetical protein